MRGLLDKILRAREVLVAAGGARKVEMVRDLDADPAVGMSTPSRSRSWPSGSGRSRPSGAHRRLRQRDDG
jgi:hypothetical protein